MPWIVLPGDFPLPAIHRGAILKGAHRSGFKVFQALMLIVVSIESQPQPWWANARAMATELTARSMTKSVVPVTATTCWQ